jgi:hypothetical protein
VGLLAWALISLTSTEQSLADHAGSTGWTYWSHLRLPLVLAAWTHIIADIIEHGELPRAVNGARMLVRFLTEQVPILV